MVEIFTSIYFFYKSQLHYGNTFILRWSCFLTFFIILKETFQDIRKFSRLSGNFSDQPEYIHTTLKLFRLSRNFPVQFQGLRAKKFRMTMPWYNDGFWASVELTPLAPLVNNIVKNEISKHFLMNGSFLKKWFGEKRGVEKLFLFGSRSLWPPCKTGRLGHTCYPWYPGHHSQPPLSC